jgi:hypothetical protein
MSDKEMPKEVSIMGGCPVPNLCSPLLYLAEFEAEGKAKAPRLRAQQRGRVAKGKKGRLRAALRHLWGKIRPSKADNKRFDFSQESFRPHHPGPFYYPRKAWTAKRRFESVDPVRQMPPEEEKG